VRYVPHVRRAEPPPITGRRCEPQELVAALDRRGPQVERAGDLAIASAAAALRSEAVHRIAEIQAGSDPRDTKES